MKPAGRGSKTGAAQGGRSARPTKPCPGSGDTDGQAFGPEGRHRAGCGALAARMPPPHLVLRPPASRCWADARAAARRHACAASHGQAPTAGRAGGAPAVRQLRGRQPYAGGSWPSGAARGGMRATGEDAGVGARACVRAFAWLHAGCVGVLASDSAG